MSFQNAHVYMSDIIGYKYKSPTIHISRDALMFTTLADNLQIYSACFEEQMTTVNGRIYKNVLLKMNQIT